MVNHLIFVVVVTPLAIIFWGLSFVVAFTLADSVAASILSLSSTLRTYCNEREKLPPRVMLFVAFDFASGCIVQAFEIL